MVESTRSDLSTVAWDGEQRDGAIGVAPQPLAPGESSAGPPPPKPEREPPDRTYGLLGLRSVYALPSEDDFNPRRPGDER